MMKLYVAFFRMIVLSVFFIMLTSISAFGQYCDATGMNCGFERISNVKFGTINNYSSCSPNGYGDYTSLSTLVVIGSSSLLTVSITNAYSNDQCVVYIDWNKDGDFFEANEQITLFQVPGTGTFTATIIPPQGAVSGITRMRVRLRSNGVLGPCYGDSYGETEDYTIIVSGSGPMVYNSTVVTQNNTNGAPKCQANQDIIGIAIIATGQTLPLNLSRLVISTLGSTNPGIVNNVSSIRVYYTGSDPNFSPTNLFASNPTQTGTGDINFDGSQTLIPGNNHFWVTYDIIQAAATTGHLLDAGLNQITINGINHSIVNGHPAGNRAISECTVVPAGVSVNNTYWVNGTMGIAQSGSNVSSWTSSAPGSVSISQSISTKQPSYQNANASFNYNPHIKFDGINDELSYSNSSVNLLGDLGTVIIVSTTYTSGSSETQTIFANKSGSYPDYQLKPKSNCGFGFPSGTYSPKWQMSWNSILPSVSSPDIRPQILGFQGGSTPLGFRNGIYKTTTPNMSSGAHVASQLTLGSRGDVGQGEQGKEYSPAAVAEVILYDRKLSISELNKIQSYLSIKYGITMGINGTSTNYYSADGSVIWNVSQNAGYNFDIAGIGRDDIGALDQRKSHSINGATNTTYSDILTVSKGDNFDSPSAFSNNASYLVWGRNDAIPQGDYLVDVEAPIITRFMRVWKAQQKGNVGVVTLEFNMNTVPGPTLPGTNDLNEVRLLVDADGAFNNGATLITPSYVDNGANIVRFEHEFSEETGSYFTIGSVNMAVAPLPVSLSEFTADCNNGNVDLAWTTQSETNNAYFAIEKSGDARKFDEVGRVNGHGTSSSLNQYSWTDDSKSFGLAYYRLKQTDFDGAFEYHDVISIDCHDDYPFLIYPNPTNDGVFIQNFNPEKSKLEIEVYNVLGKIIDKREISESAWLKLPDTQGIYFIKVRDGEKLFVEKIVKN